MLPTYKYRTRIEDYLTIQDLPDYKDFIHAETYDGGYDILDYSDGDYYWKFDLQKCKYEADSVGAELFEYLRANLPPNVVTTNKFGIYCSH